MGKGRVCTPLPPPSFELPLLCLPWWEKETGEMTKVFYLPGAIVAFRLTLGHCQQDLGVGGPMLTHL